MGARKKKPQKSYVFIDTNKFLDFYRSRNETSLSLLSKLDKVKDRVICTYQVEMEFLKNRQSVILNEASSLGLSLNTELPAVMDDSHLSSGLRKLKSDTTKRNKAIRKRIIQVLEQPAKYDEIYRTLKPIFASSAGHVLTRDMAIRKQIKRLAWRRFVLGYPPRKAKDTSIGDAINWEWFIHCAKELRGKFIIVSRDTDYGISIDGRDIISDALKAEFRDRVGNKSLTYTTRLSEALKQLEVHVTEREAAAEPRPATLQPFSNQDLVAATKKLYGELNVPSSELQKILANLANHESDIQRVLTVDQMQSITEKYQKMFEGLESATDKFKHLGLFIKPIDTDGD